MLLILNKRGSDYAAIKILIQTCVHNKQFLCDLDEYSRKICKIEETCCDSFQEKGRKLHKFYERGFRLFLR